MEAKQKPKSRWVCHRETKAGFFEFQASLGYRVKPCLKKISDTKRMKGLLERKVFQVPLSAKCNPEISR
jgi:hypothetical protein